MFHHQPIRFGAAEPGIIALVGVPGRVCKASRLWAIVPNAFGANSKRLHLKGNCRRVFRLAPKNGNLPKKWVQRTWRLRIKGASRGTPPLGVTRGPHGGDQE